MPLNERHFNGSRLLKHFIRMSLDPVDTLKPLGPLVAETERLWGFPLKWPVLVRTPSHKAFSMEIWLAFWFHTTLRPCFWVTLGAEAWTHINIRGVREQRDSRDLAAKEEIWIEAMDVSHILLLFVLHLTCKYYVLYSTANVTRI